MISGETIRSYNDLVRVVAPAGSVNIVVVQVRSMERVTDCSGPYCRR